jgi:hypothetical protein
MKRRTSAEKKRESARHDLRKRNERKGDRSLLERPNKPPGKYLGGVQRSELGNLKQSLEVA